MNKIDDPNHNKLFEKFKRFITLYPFSPQDAALPEALLLSSEKHLKVYYAPFEHVNIHARVVICGITPGLQQALLALIETKRHLAAGSPVETALKSAKETASFGGSMRKNLIAMLDHVEVNQLLGIESCEQLFSSDKHLVHYTSALRYPTFISGKNYSGTPNMVFHPHLISYIESYLAAELKILPKDCIFIPLGSKVTEVLAHMAATGLIEPYRILAGIPHPSGANAERISYFLGKKRKEDLSNKTNPYQIDAARAELIAKIKSC